MPLKRRAQMYAEAFPNYPPLACDGRWLYGIWMIGNYYKRKYGYYGEYPPSYLKRVLSMFPEANRRLHAFSGVVEDEGSIRVDSNLSLQPTCVADARRLPFVDSAFDLCLADPPYTTLDAEKYGTAAVHKPRALRELARVTRSGGHIVWLDLIVPIYSKQVVNMIGNIGLFTGTNRKVRMVSVFEVR